MPDFPHGIYWNLQMNGTRTFKANEMIPLVLPVQKSTAWTVGGRNMVGSRAITTSSLVVVTNSSTWYQNSSARQISPRAPGQNFEFEWSASFVSDNADCPNVSVADPQGVDLQRLVEISGEV